MNLKKVFHTIVLIFLAAWFVATLLVIIQSRIPCFPPEPPLYDDVRPNGCGGKFCHVCWRYGNSPSTRTRPVKIGLFRKNLTPCLENGLETFLRAHLMRIRFTYLFPRTLRTGFLPTERARTFIFPYLIIPIEALAKPSRAG